MRTIIGKLYDSSDRPRAGVSVKFERRDMLLKNGRLYLPDSHTAVTGSNGAFSIDLIETTDSELPAKWRCTIPGEGAFEFDLLPGEEPVNLAELRANNG